MAGASTIWFSSATAETFITPRPRLPSITRKPPSGENARATGRRMFSSRLSIGPSRHTNSPSIEERLLGVTAQAVAEHGIDVFVQQARFEQLADQERHAAGGLEVVHVGLAVRIDAAQQRHDFGEVGHVLPGRA